MKWYAPHGVDLKGNSVNESGINTFTDKVLESLVRETVQNSLDVVVDDSKPLHMSFNLKSIPTSNIPNIDFFTNTAIPEAKLKWSHDSNAIKYLDDYLLNLKQSKVSVLKISDFNTLGLEENEWNALINDQGSSIKRGEDAGGSYGIGKSAPFASSKFRMIFYETLLENGSKKSIGVTNFLSYDFNLNNEIHTTEGTCYLGKEKREPMYKFGNLGFDERTKRGTDIYVIGFNQERDWEENIIKFALKNFMVALHDEMVTFDVGNTTVSKDSLKFHFNSFQNDKELDTTRKYYDVYSDPNSLKIPLDDRFEKYNFKPEDAYLLIAQSENANRKVLMTRKSGMEIYQRSNISGSIQFNGIFRAIGTELNRVLRSMENPRHDKWEESLLSTEDQSKYKDLNINLLRFFRDQITEAFKIYEGASVDAYGLSDFLPSDSGGDSKEDIDINEVIGLKLKDRSIKATSIDTDDETNQDWGGSHWGEREQVPGEPDPENAGKNGGKRDPLGKSPDGNVPYKKYSSKISSSSFNYRIIEFDATKGLYRLLLTPLKNFKEIAIEIYAVSESDFSYPINISEAFHQNKKIDERNVLYLEDVLENQTHLIEFETSQNSRFKMEVKIYENKE